MRSRIVFCTVATMLMVGLAAPAATQSAADARVRIASQSDSATTSRSEIAGNSPLQRPITLTLVDVPLEHALETIAREAGLTLGYAPQLLPERALVSIGAQHRAAGELLSEVLAGVGLAFRSISDKQITLVPIPEGGSEAGRPRTGIITGRVTSAETGAGLPGASVRIDGTHRGTLTGSDGRYRLDGIPDGGHVLIASRIGYMSQHQEVTVSPTDTTVADFELTISAVSLDQVVVTGTLTPTEVRAIPTPISVISGAEIERRQVQRLDQLFRGAIPGIVAWDVGPVDYYSEVNVRGKSSMSLNYMKTYIDGVEIANPFYIAMIDPNSIERIEVLRGPQGSTMYGSDAAGGVLQIFTKQGVSGRQRPQIDVQVSGGVTQSDYAANPVTVQDHSAAVRGGQENATFNLGGSFSDRGDYLPEASRRNRSAFAGLQTSQGPFTMEISGRYFDRRSGTARNPLLAEAGYTAWSKPFNRTNDVRGSTLGATVTFRHSPRWTQTLIVGRDESSSATHGDRPRLTTPADTFVEVSMLGEMRNSLRYQSALQLQPSEHIAGNLTFGVDYYRFSNHAFTTSTAAQSSGSLSAVRIDGSRNEWTNTGYFSQAQIGLSDALFLTGGVRVEENENFGQSYGLAVAPRAGIAYSHSLLGGEAKVRGSWGKSIRPPQPHHKQAALYPFAKIVPNPDIGPEEQVGWDAGAEFHWGGRGSIGITRYRQRAIGLIDRVVDNSENLPIWQFQNTGVILNEGWEFESNFYLAPVRLSATYSIVESTVLNLSPSYTGALQPGDQSLRVPKRSAGLTADVKVRRGTVGLDLTYFGPFVETDWLAFYSFAFGGDDFRGSMRDYWMTYDSVTKLGARFDQRLGDHVSVFGRADNLTDRQLGERTNVTIGPGRTLVLGMRVTY